MKHSLIPATTFLLVSFMLWSCSGDSETPSPTPSPEPEPEPTAVSFSATLSDSSPFKSVWSASDPLIVTASASGKTTSELIKPGSISEDGKSATLTSTGTLPSGADKYYAYLSGTGITYFKDGAGWVTADMGKMTKSPQSVLAATAANNSLSFKNIYSAIKVSVTSDKIASIVFEGAKSETVNRENIISCTDLSVSASTSPAFEQTASITGSVSDAGDYYVNLYPGLVLENGYRISGYNFKGKLIAVAESNDRFESVSGTCIYAPELKIDDTRTKVFNPDNIEYSFGVISDVHLDGDASSESGKKFYNALTLLQNQAKMDDADGVDGVLVVGDLLDSPYHSQSYTEADWYKSIYESVFNPVNVPMIYTIGNHDTYGQWCSITYSEALKISQRLGDNYFLTDTDRQMLEQYQCRHCVIGDCNILCVTPNSSSPVLYPTAITDWLDSKLLSLTTEEPEKYILLLTHPMIYNTVYGSTLGDYWYTEALTEILKKYPQVIVFGGHLHFPVNDPRSIWQGDFTSIGCGSVRYMAIEEGYAYSKGTVPKDAYDITTGHLVQIDGSGNVRVTRMFFTESAPFSSYWTIPYPASDKSHLQPYRFDTRKSANTAPQLSQLTAKCSGELPSKTVTASFTSGTDDDFVHHYLLTLKQDGTVVSTKKILADFYRHTSPSEMNSSWSVLMGDTFGAGNYELTLTAYDSWDAQSETKTYSFSIE